MTYIVHEQAPEQIATNNGVCLNGAEELGQRGSLRVVPSPVIFSRNVDLVDRFHECDIVLKLGYVWRVVMIREDVDRGNGEVRLVNPIRSVNDQLIGCKLLDVVLLEVSTSAQTSFRERKLEITAI